MKIGHRSCTEVASNPGSTRFEGNDAGLRCTESLAMRALKRILCCFVSIVLLTGWLASTIEAGCKYTGLIFERFDDGSSAWLRISTLPKTNEGFERHVIYGTINYRQRVAILPGSVVEVRVEDNTRTGVPPLGSTCFKPTGQVPIPFRVELPETGMDALATYAISARIYGPDGRLLFVGDKTYQVSAGAARDKVDLVLVPSGNPKPEKRGC